MPSDAHIDVVDEDGNLLPPQEVAAEVANSPATHHQEDIDESLLRCETVVQAVRDPNSTHAPRGEVVIDSFKEDEGAKRIARARQLATPYLHKDVDVPTTSSDGLLMYG